MSNSDGIPQLGIKLSLFEELAELWKCQVDDLSKLTTKDVCEQIVKPLTFQKKTSLTAQLADENNSGVGIASVFISHGWKMKFLDVLDALRFHFREKSKTEDIILWFDLFSNNQHECADFDFYWWCTTFK